MIYGLFIFRRDFRIKDNTAWNEMIKEYNNIYPIFIFTPEQIDNNKYKSDNAIQFMIESLIELKKRINLTFCYGNIEDVINDIINKNNIDAIYTNTDYTPYSLKREILIEKIAKNKDIIFKYFHDITLFEPKSIKTISGQIYQKFTPFYNQCMKEKVRKPITNKNKVNIKKVNTKYEINKKKIDNKYIYNNDIFIHGGRINAIKILKNINKFNKYDKTRNILNINTTNLSAYLKFGCVSIREAYYQIKKQQGKKAALIRQLIWRDFYYHLGDGFIDRFGNSLKEQYDNIKWDNNIKLFNKWKNGETGFPIVDACMRQLNKTGYMHNRGRLIVSSFLIKNLMIDWRWGEKYFAQKLIDYDVFVNQGNWQWTSGSGADSQPYFRVFNPALQSEKFDPDAKYIKKWIPELKDIEPKHIHYWEEYYNDSYIKPIINYKESKIKSIKMYKKGLY